MRIGYSLSSEEHGPVGLVDQARLAEQAGSLVSPGMVAEAVSCRSGRHVAALEEYADASLDELYVQQTGSRQDDLFEVSARDALPHFA